MIPHGYLIHHGIIGQKWGVRRYQNKDGSLTEAGKKHYQAVNTSKTAKSYNLDSLGNSPKNNVLYVTGLSGSGKSTFANNRNGEKIELDVYLYKGGKWRPNDRNKDFDNFCKERGFEVPELGLIPDHIRRKPTAEERKNVDKFNDLIQEFGAKKHKDGVPVIVEGVQVMANDELFKNPSSSLKGKPLIVSNANLNTATKRIATRNGMKPGDPGYSEFVAERRSEQKSFDIDRQALISKLDDYECKKPYKKTDTVFMSGKVQVDGKTLDDIPDGVKREIDKVIKKNATVIVGDAPGADTAIQKYLDNLGYKNVKVYTADPEVRNNVGKWEVEKIGTDGLTDDRDIRLQKDIAMTKAATRALAISPDDDRPDSAMSKNIDRLNEQSTPVRRYDPRKDRWIY